MAKARPTMLRINPTIKTMSGTILVKPWDLPKAVAQTDSQMPASMSTIHEDMASFRQVLSLSGYLTIVREPALDSEHQNSAGQHSDA